MCLIMLVWNRQGEAFNSLVELDNRSNRPFNPMINSGAITVASLLVNHYSIEDMQKYMQDVCEDPEIAVDEAVFSLRWRLAQEIRRLPIF